MHANKLTSSKIVDYQDIHKIDNVIAKKKII